MKIKIPLSNMYRTQDSSAREKGEMGCTAGTLGLSPELPLGKAAGKGTAEK